MAEMVCCGKKITLDPNGFITDPEAWDECVAEGIAKHEGFDHLSEEQRAIVMFMRSYYQKFHSFPILNYVCKRVHQSGKCVFNEFDNPEKAWKIAGLPKFEGVNFVKLDGEHYHMEDYC